MLRRSTTIVSEDSVAPSTYGVLLWTSTSGRCASALGVDCAQQADLCYIINAFFDPLFMDRPYGCFAVGACSKDREQRISR